ncbi:asparagine synthase (glutamine-hydrolyzing) [Fodinibius sp. Rm-B-1B1-1]|uniref:asparagine synthase (glutamine-hydrolyzing) n=1 Tax=Fodinibius alkaliphilus TaxID=3140241 RepID=UPI00315A6F48
MCGIVGYVSKKQWNLKKGVDSISHRGPDYQNYEITEYRDSYVGFGHARLSIIGLNPESNQPMSIEEGKFKIIYNGEIYNYKSLRRDLESKNVNFRTDSDTEVLLKYYKEYGVKGLRELKGMFAFSILDRTRNELIFVRDPLGIKPLYYWQNNRGVFWSSELKGIWNLIGTKANIDPDVLTEHLSTGFLYEPDTGYKNVYKVPPASYVKVKLNSYNGDTLIPKRYWSLNKRETNIEELRQKVRSSIENHLVSDVPVGLFYSGGVDSSLILSKVEKNIKPFIVKSEEKEYEKAGMTNDYEYGKKIAGILNKDIKEVSLNNKEGNRSSILEDITHIAKLSEEPIKDYTFISSMGLSKEVSREGYKVMLSGMGADEIFSGYPRYQLAKYGKYFAFFFPFLKPFMKLSNYLEKKIERFSNYFGERGFARKYNTLLTPFSRAEIDRLIIDGANFNKFDKKIDKILDKCPFQSPLKKAMFLDRYGFLSHNFLVADKSSMQAGIELRVPLATHELFELSMNLPDRKLMSVSKTKKILKNMLYEELPKKLVDRRKAGFHPPIDSKIMELGNNKIISYLKNNELFDLISYKEVRKILDEHFNGKQNNTFKIYRLLYLSAWYNENK